MASTTVLWIDDDQLLLAIGTDALAQRGYRVLTAPDGAAGMALAHREHPDLILLDVIMPSMYGLEVCQQLRADPALQTTPIILLTVLGDPSVVGLGAKAGATLTMQKPRGVELICQMIEQVLGRVPGSGSPPPDQPRGPAGRGM
jgi:DNA-binding response OmpR family regulator